MIHDLCKSEGSSDSLRAYLTELASDSAEKVQILLNEKDDSKYTPLHIAIFERNLAAVNILIEFGADVNAKCHGTPCLQLALRVGAQPDGSEFGFATFRLLMSSPDISLSAKDDNGMTVLHLASLFNFSDMVTLILGYPEGKDLVNTCSQATGITPLHLAALNNAAAAAEQLVSAGASTIKQLTICGSTPLHCAAIAKSSEIWSLLSPLTRDIVDHAGNSPRDILIQDGYTISENGLFHSAMSSLKPTAIVYGPICFEHYTCPPAETRTNSAPPENLHRLHVLIDEKDGILKSKPLKDHTTWYAQSTPCPLADVLRVHEWSYVRRVQAKCSGISEDLDTSACIDSLDGDTAISRKTFSAALVAAGAVCTAVDKVMTAEATNAFCPVRPPGHHAGPLGSVKGENGSESHGFCILNNVSIGAAYALNHYREHVKKVAIVDFDVHHGNGTEETVRWLQPHCTETEFFNINGFGKMYTPRFKPWFSENDPENVLFVSVHGYGPPQRGMEAYFPAAAFYPGSGKTLVPEIYHSGGKVGHQPGQPTTTKVSSVAVHALEDGIDDSDEDEDYGVDDAEENDGDSYEDSIQANGGGTTVDGLLALYDYVHQSNHLAPPLILDIGVSLSSSEFSTPFGKLTEETRYRFQWRDYFRNIIFPRLMKFKPDMIFISAGFDAHKKDTINAGYISLIEEDFQWVTDKLVEIANSSCGGRIVSVLEGGYQLGGEHSSAFAKSVFAHVHSLAVGSRTKRKFDAHKQELEVSAEKKIIASLETKRDEDLQKRLQAKQEMEERWKQQQLLAAQDGDGDGSNKEQGLEEVGGRKRRRAQVDYVALDKELSNSR